MSHTKGPWTRGGLTSDGWHIYAGEVPIAQTMATVPESEERANGRLLAAAPDLLEACKNAVTSLAITELPRRSDVCASDREIIAIVKNSLKAAIHKGESGDMKEPT